MQDVKRTIEKIQLVVQCIGTPEVWFSSAHPTGFPGIAVPEPDVLQLCRSGVLGRTIRVPDVDAKSSDNDKQAYVNTSREQITALFEGAVGARGPGSERWSLGLEATATIWDKIIWVWGTEAISIALATRPLGPTGAPVCGAPPEPYTVTYDVPTSDGKNVARILARFNLLFHLVE